MGTLPLRALRDFELGIARAAQHNSRPACHGNFPELAVRLKSDPLSVRGEKGIAGTFRSFQSRCVSLLET
jgi:hypothetical protein